MSLIKTLHVLFTESLLAATPRGNKNTPTLVGPMALTKAA